MLPRVGAMSPSWGICGPPGWRGADTAGRVAGVARTVSLPCSGLGSPRPERGRLARTARDDHVGVALAVLMWSHSYSYTHVRRHIRAIRRLRGLSRCARSLDESRLALPVGGLCNVKAIARVCVPAGDVPQALVHFQRSVLNGLSRIGSGGWPF